MSHERPEARGPHERSLAVSPSRAVPCSPSHEDPRPRPVHPLHPDRRADRGQQRQPVQLALWPLPHSSSCRSTCWCACCCSACWPGWAWAGGPAATIAGARAKRAARRPAWTARSAPAPGRCRCAATAPASGPAPRDQKAIERQSALVSPELSSVRHARPLHVKILSAAEVDASLDDLALIDRLDALFRAGCEMPPRHHHKIAEPTGPGSADAMLLLMPAWTRGPHSHLGIKVVTVFPDNGRRSLPSIYGQYLLLDGATGETVAMLDGTMLTKRRTACASGLASRYLSRPDSRAAADDRHRRAGPATHPRHAKVRPIGEVAIWGRRPEQAHDSPTNFRFRCRALSAADHRSGRDRPQAGGRGGRHRLLRDAFQDAACRGRLAAAGGHMSIWSGAFTPPMRESDDDAVGAPGSMSIPAPAPPRRPATSSSRWPTARSTTDAMVADLFELARGEKDGRLPRDADDDHPVQVGRRRTRGSCSSRTRRYGSR